MAVIGKIRKNTGLLIFIVALAMVGFLLMDSLQSNTSILGGQGQVTNVVGIIDGQKVDYRAFEARVEQLRKNFVNRQPQGYTPTERDNFQLREEAWRQLVQESIYGNIYEELGISVTPMEEADMLLGKTLHQEVLRAFTNPETQQFNPEFVRQHIQTLDQDQEGTLPGTKRSQWEAFMADLKKIRLEEKYRALLTKGMYAPKWMVQDKHNAQAGSVNFEYVQIPYASITEEQLGITQKELQAYLSKYSDRYKQDESRKLKLIYFNIKPSKTDTIAAKEYVTGKLEAFQKAKSDSLYVKAYSSTSFDAAYYKKNEVENQQLADTIFTMDTGDIYGPFLTAKGWELVKLTDKKLISDSVKVRHLLFSNDNVQTQEDVTRIFRVADSLLGQLDSFGASFDSIILKYSEDLATRNTGGDLGWIMPGIMEKTFNDYAFFQGKPGKYDKIITSQGLHIVEVTQTNPTTPAVKVSYLSRSIISSPETERNIYRQASTFAGKHNTQSDFLAAYDTVNIINKRTVEYVNEMDYTISGDMARSVVQWAYSNEEGNVSSVLSIKNKHVVAFLELVREEGVPKIADIEEELTRDLASQMKVDLVKEQVGGKALEDAASQYGSTVQSADAATLNNPSLADGSSEPAVIATAFGLEANEVSQPIKGSNGIYVVRLLSKALPPDTDNFKPYVNLIRSDYTLKISNELQDGLKNSVEIEDNRSVFY